MRFSHRGEHFRGKTGAGGGLLRSGRIKLSRTRRASGRANKSRDENGPNCLEKIHI